MGVPVVLALVVGLACSFIQSFGLTIQRKSHVQEELKPLAERRKAIRRPMWIVGFAVYISSNIFGSVFQIGALPIVVLAPLGGISLLWNSLLAHVILGEGFTSAMLLGTVLIAGGAALIAVFGVVPDENHSLNELLELWARPAFVVFFVAVCLAVVLTLAGAHVAVWRVNSRGIRLPTDEEDVPPSNYASPQTEPAIPFRPTCTSRASEAANANNATTARNGHNVSPLSSISGIFDGKVVRFAPPTPGSEGGKPDANESALVIDEPSADRTLILAGLAFGAASGTLSGLCLVLAKAAVELVISTINYWHTGKGSNEFARLQTWFLVAGLGLAAVLQLVYLNYSLLFASPALICPLAFCFFNLASIFDGLVFYNQLSQLATHQVLLVSAGVAILLVGVWSVSEVRPSGEGGVEMGTWVEEEALHEEPLLDADAHHDELEPGHGATLLGGETVSEPDMLPYGHPGAMSTPPASPNVNTTIVRVGTTPPSPSSPVSPTLPRRRRRPTRYGTLFPEHLPAGAPAGFAFGIGAASPGFALRSQSISFGSGPSAAVPSPVRRGRSRSDVDTGSIHAASHLPPLPPPPRPRRRPLSMPATSGPSGPDGVSSSGPGAPVMAVPDAPSAGASAPHIEDAIASWDAPSPAGWQLRWPWKRGSGGQIKLP